MNEIVLKPIGVIRSPIADRSSGPKQGSEASVAGELVVDEQYADGFLGLETGKKIVILYWMHLADQSILQVHPRGDPTRPVRGVFTTRSPDRPNPISVDIVEVTGINGTVIEVKGLDAIDGTPLIDIKCVE
jgi:tRNA-Thr(GGU) m(6)t(6)A37 methyltransferase TsaA